MKSASRILTFGVVLALAPLAAEARPVHHAKADAGPSVKARRAAMDGFTARMNRLDALMGISPTTRTRSASAER